MKLETFKGSSFLTRDQEIKKDGLVAMERGTSQQDLSMREPGRVVSCTGLEHSEILKAVNPTMASFIMG